MKHNRIILLVVSSLFIVSACGTSVPSSSEASLEPSSTSESSVAPSSSTIPESSLDPSSSESSETPSSSTAPETKLEHKKINAYRLFNRDNKYLDPDLSDDKYKLGQVNFSFIKGQYFVPYITLDDMSDLYGRFYKEKEATKNIVSVEGDKNTWTVLHNNAQVFTSTIDTKNKTFTYKGDMEGFIEPKKDYSKYSFGLRTIVVNSVIDLPSKKDPLVSYANTDFEVINENGVYYYPFSMLHTFYHELTGHDFFYNYVNLYEYSETGDLSTADITDGDKVFKLFEQMEEYISKNVTEKDVSNQPLMPMYLRKYHRSEFTLIMDNYYGLRETWGVSSMSDYYKTYGLYEKFIDDNSAVRGAAYSGAFFMLSDNHTGRPLSGDNPWAEKNGNADVPSAYASTLTTDRLLLDGALADQRNKFLKSKGYDELKNTIIYSDDGKTAYFGFDSFEASEKAYKADGITVKSDDELAKEDSFYYFMKILKEIKAKGGVENVIIDDSLNGGGYVAIMGKLIALLSKDNKGTMYFRNGLTNSVTKSVYSVDSNDDGQYNEKDVYGNTFKFYILTSPKSFSCGNAFPILSQNQCGVKLIGAKSGGGECVVGDNYLSNGMTFVHSSNEHIILLNEEKKTYQGVEDGANVDKSIKYNSFYDMDAMIKALV